MTRAKKMGLSALVNGVIAALGALMAVVSEIPAGAEVSDIGSITWLVISVTGILTAAKDAQAFLKS